MHNITLQPRASASRLEKVVFGPINTILSFMIEKTFGSKRLFDFFGRILPTPRQVVRGIPIKIIMPLNQVGVFNTFKTWEEREPEVLDWIDRFEKNCIFFDVGASFGTETLYAALKPNGPDKIVAFDLSLEASFNLAYNISLNNINNVSQYYLGISNKFSLQSFRDTSQYYFVKGRDKYDWIYFNTIAISMDQFIDITEIFPDYIKIDVDGAEENIVLGMAKTIKEPKLKSVVVEVSDKSEPTITTFFKDAGFKVELERTWAEENGPGFKNIVFTRK